MKVEKIWRSGDAETYKSEIRDRRKVLIVYTHKLEKRFLVYKQLPANSGTIPVARNSVQTRSFNAYHAFIRNARRCPRMYDWKF